MPEPERQAIAIFTDNLQEELWAAFKAGVEEGANGFDENEQELQIAFAVHMRMRANRKRKQREEAR